MVEEGMEERIKMLNSQVKFMKGLQVSSFSGNGPDELTWRILTQFIFHRVQSSTRQWQISYNTATAAEQLWIPSRSAVA